MRAVRTLVVAAAVLAATPVHGGAQTWKDVLGQVTGQNGGDTSGKAAAGQEAAEPSGAAVSSEEAAGALEEALEIGVRKAVEAASAADGFLGNDAIRIPIPKRLRSVAATLRKLGMGDTADEFEETLNHAAEKASAEAMPILVDAVRGLTFEDATAILRGGDTAATDYLRKATEAKLRTAFTPIVEKAMTETGVTSAYQRLVRQAGPYLAMAGQGQQEDLTPYVTERTLDGLFTLIAEQEKAIRKDPMARTTDLLRKVFGTLTGEGD